MSDSNQATGGTASSSRGTRVIATMAACLLAGGGWGAPAIAQTPAPGWTLIVRIVPNPVSIGRCAGLSVEPQDEEGYRRNELSNGGALDFHEYRYEADTTNFQWQNGDPVTGALCARAGAPPSSVTVTVTLPDGLAGSVTLTSIAPGQSAVAVQYAPQAPLRRPGVPPPHARVGVAAAPALTGVGTRVPSTSGTAGAASAGATATDQSSLATPPMLVQTAALTMTGSSIAAAPQVVTTGALTMIGGAIPSSVQLVTTAPLSMIGSAP